MLDGGSKGILGEVYSSNFGVIGQSIDDRLDGRSEDDTCPADDMKKQISQVLAFRRNGGRK